MAKKKLKRRKPKPNPEPEVKKDSNKLVSKGKATRLYPENGKWFESGAASTDFKKIKGRLTKTRKVSGGG